MTADVDSRAPSRPFNLIISAETAERVLFWVSVAGAAGMMWLAPRLPMLDLPQHAAQIALWRDLLMGTSRWSHLVYINLLTPYLIGYGLALPFAVLFSAETAVRIVLTMAFLGFVAGCIGLRREIGSDKRLDWLFLPGFFGFDWKLGFLTFLAAAPVLFGLLILALRYARAPTVAKGCGLVVAGIALLFSHGLVFLFGMLIVGLLLLGPLKERWESRLARLAPVIVLTAILVLFAIVTSDRGTAAHYDHWRMGVPIWLRPVAALIFISGSTWNLDPLLAGLAAVAMLTPFFIGPRANRGAPRILMFALVFVFFALPSEAFQTGFLFHRFALFILPFFAFQFRTPEFAAPHNGANAPARFTMIAACLATLAIQGSRIWVFGQESRSFNRIEQAARPGKRALGIVFDGNSPGASNKVVYDHFPLWYQADHHGFVDFNFAAFHPQIVRFRPNEIPTVGQQFVARFKAFDWQKDHAWIYRYFFIRGSASRVDWLKARSPCKLSLVAADAPWFLVRRDSCPAGSHTPS